MQEQGVGSVVFLVLSIILNYVLDKQAENRRIMFKRAGLPYTTPFTRLSFGMWLDQPDLMG